MGVNSLRGLFAVALMAVASQCWATVSLPVNQDPKWNDISGIVWSTDGGSTWGNSTLNVGQSVSFKFTLHKTYDGMHYADFIKTWIDWNGDEQFSASETLLFGAHVVHPTSVANTGPGNIVNQSFNFISSPITLTNAMLGSHFLLARVTCSESLLTAAGVSGPWSHQWDSVYTSSNNAGYNNLFSPTATYIQGESELRSLKVLPEPGTLALFAVGMVGLGFGKKRMTRR